jgi:predicted MFS family arabinose efflux permease
LKQRIGSKILLFAGILGALAWIPLGQWNNWILLSISLVGFGLACVMIQPVLVNEAQRLLPKQKGTVMSLVSFNMFVGGGVGTYVFGLVQNECGFNLVFIIAGLLIFLAGFIGMISLNRIAELVSERIMQD